MNFIFITQNKFSDQKTVELKSQSVLLATKIQTVFAQKQHYDVINSTGQFGSEVTDDHVVFHLRLNLVLIFSCFRIS